MSVHNIADRSAGTPATQLAVFADLRLENDGQKVHLVGDGQSLILHLNSPLDLLSALRQTPLPSSVGWMRGPRVVGRAATALRDAGLSVHVRGPEGVLVLLGDGAESRVGRLVTGSDAVRFGSARDLTSTLTARLPIKAIIAGATAGAAAVVLGLLAARHRHR